MYDLYYFIKLQPYLTEPWKRVVKYFVFFLLVLFKHFFFFHSAQELQLIFVVFFQMHSLLSMQSSLQTYLFKLAQSVPSFQLANHPQPAVEQGSDEY